MGLYTRDSDGKDLNAAAVHVANPDHSSWPKKKAVRDESCLALAAGAAAGRADYRNQHVVVGDDYGNVIVAKHPCLSADAPRALYKGHTAEVTSVIISADGSTAFTSGGQDRTVFQWAVTDRCGAHGRLHD